MRRPTQHPEYAKDENWRMAVRGNRLFFYWRTELMPRYRFERSAVGAVWRGHDVRHVSMRDAFLWVKRQERRT